MVAHGIPVHFPVQVVNVKVANSTAANIKTALIGRPKKEPRSSFFALSKLHKHIFRNSIVHLKKKLCHMFIFNELQFYFISTR